MTRAATSSGSAVQILHIKGDGYRSPILFIVANQDELSLACEVSQYLDTELPIIVLAIRALPIVEAELVSGIQDAAKVCIRDMRGLRSSGPYGIVGWRGAGLLGCEIASQLIASDEPVAFLAILDFSAQQIARTARKLGDAIDQRVGALVFAEGNEMLFLLGGDYAPSPVSAPTFIFKRSNALLPVEDFSEAWMSGVGTTKVNIEMQIQDLDGERTCRHIAKALSEKTLELTLSMSICPELKYEPRITIENGLQGLQPLFCVPGAGASATSFLELANALDSRIPIHALQQRGLDGELAPYIDVPTAARSYVRAIRKSMPKGPYQLVGHSFGGWVVFEVARQLVADGCEVGVVMVLESRAPCVPNRGHRYKRSAALMKLVHIYEMFADCKIPVLESDFESLNAERQLRLLLDLLVNHKILPRRATVDSLRGVVRVFEANLNTAYEPTGQYNGVVHLVTAEADDASENSEARSTSMLSGWRSFAPSTKLWRSEGNHMSLLKAPHVVDLAAWLQPLLRY